jgi:hypothetical protein
LRKREKLVEFFWEYEWLSAKKKVHFERTLEILGLNKLEPRIKKEWADNEMANHESDR